ncbi:MAG: PhnD/SsuA/transferrin family substrate-binding protein [Oscillospiraceae bacterium]|nr:PhnD/SsuA/transferrin family substrate-binding protein [Oscillospiraceae bacterium]
MKRLSAWLLAMILLLCACGGEESPDAPLPQNEPIILESLTLECSAPAGSGSGFPAAANAFGAALQQTLAAEGVEVGAVQVTFSRVDAATIDALGSGGVTLGMLGLGGALVEQGEVLLALSRNEEESSCALLIAGGSEYGKQLAWRTKTTPLTAEEWSRARIGAVEGDSVALAAARQLLHESAGCTIEEYRGYATAEELLAAAQLGEVDAAIIRAEDAEDAEDFWALTENAALYEGTVVLSPAAQALQSEQGRDALRRALLAAAKTDAGRELLKQYGCGGFAAVSEEEIAAMRDLAMWEELG